MPKTKPQPVTVRDPEMARACVAHDRRPLADQRLFRIHPSATRLRNSLKADDNSTHAARDIRRRLGNSRRPLWGLIQRGLLIPVGVE
ncbi:MAG: hypothetical protein KDA41_08565, partial [Planctomycetales bacterium]|nr:hypothetical protein [Planctomycetales bacterium]